jgi:hypothetical protein
MNWEVGFTKVQHKDARKAQASCKAAQALNVLR